MEIFWKDDMPSLHVKWEITRGKTSVREDFSRAQVWAFLTYEFGATVKTVYRYDETAQEWVWDNEANTNRGMRPLSIVKNLADGILEFDIPSPDDVNKRLDVGVYGLKLIWIKNGSGSWYATQDILASNKMCLSEVHDLFGVSASQYAVTNNDSSVTINIKSSAATYGYDGLSAYERAVVLGETTDKDEVEWLEKSYGFRPRGEYDASKVYQKYDIVYRKLRIYISLRQDNQGHDLPLEGSENEWWKEYMGISVVPNEMLAPLSVTEDKIAGGYFYDEGIGTWTWTLPAVTEDKLGEGAVTEDKIADSNVTTAKIADGNVTTPKIADGNVTTIKIADSNVTTAKIADSNVTTAKIADGNVTTAKIEDEGVTTIKIADSNVTTAKIADGNVTTAKIKEGAVTTEKIGNGEVKSANIGSGEVKSANIGSGEVKSANIGSGEVKSSNIGEGEVKTANIGEGEVKTANIGNGEVKTANIDDGNVTTAKIADGNVTTAKIADGNVTTAKIADSNVTTAKIADGNITTEKIATGAVTEDKIADGAIDELRGMYETFQAQIAALAADFKVTGNTKDANNTNTISCVYRGVEQTFYLNGAMSNAPTGDGITYAMALKDGSTSLQTSTTTSISKKIEDEEITADSKTYTVEGTVLELTKKASVTINARYPIYVGCGTSAAAVAVDANKLTARTSAAGTYTKSTSANGQHLYVIVPPDVSALSSFTMGGAPFLMTATTDTINSIANYKIYESTNTYNSGTQLKVTAS